MNARITLLAVLSIGLVFNAGAQFAWNGQAAVHAGRSAATQSPRAVNSGRPYVGWQSDLFFRAEASANTSVESTVDFSDDGQIVLEEFVIRLTDVTALGWNVEAGKILLPFGNLGDRRYPRRNVLFGLPLMYEYRMALPDNVTTAAIITANRGKGLGMRFLDRGMYDLGVSVSGSWGIMDYAFAVSNGTVSSVSYGTGNANSDFGKVLRFALTPMTGLTVGGSYAWGAYLEAPDQSLLRSVDVNRYVQTSAGIDCSFSRGHAVLNGEVVRSTWPAPFETRDANLTAWGYYLEGKYTLFPRFYLALRANGLVFEHADLGQGNQPWDFDLSEWEGGAGYFLDRNVLLKLVRRETRAVGIHRPDNLTVLQLVVAFEGQ